MMPLMSRIKVLLTPSIAAFHSADSLPAQSLPGVAIESGLMVCNFRGGPPTIRVETAPGRHGRSAWFDAKARRIWFDTPHTVGGVLYESSVSTRLFMLCRGKLEERLVSLCQPRSRHAR